MQSLIKEVYTSPKPGLVDQRNNGSHKDMDLSTFLASAHALQPYFSECVRIGQETSSAPIECTFFRLREAGIRAENTMYHITGGVNTHKGAIYTMGLLCGSLGRLRTPEQPIPNVEALLSECSPMAKISFSLDPASETDHPTANCATGGRQNEDYLAQLPGARSNAATGLPSVYHISLPAYKKALQAGLSTNDADYCVGRRFYYPQSIPRRLCRPAGSYLFFMGIAVMKLCCNAHHTFSYTILCFPVTSHKTSVCLIPSARISPSIGQ